MSLQHDPETITARVQIKSMIKFISDMDKTVVKFDKNLQLLETIIMNCSPPDEDLKAFYDKFLNLKSSLQSILLDVKVDNSKTIENFKRE